MESQKNNYPKLHKYLAMTYKKRLGFKSNYDNRWTRCCQNSGIGKLRRQETKLAYLAQKTEPQKDKQSN